MFNGKTFAVCESSQSIYRVVCSAFMVEEQKVSFLFYIFNLISPSQSLKNDAVIYALGLESSNRSKWFS